MKFYEVTVKTRIGTDLRYYRKTSPLGAVRSAETKSDCFEVLKVEEISETQYNERKATSNQSIRSSHCFVGRNMKLTRS